MRTSALLTASVLAAVVVAGCIGGPGNAGVAWIRNEPSEPIDVAIGHPSHGLFGGTAHISFLVPPWQQGWCYAFGYGINAGSVAISVEGPSVPFPTSTTTSVLKSPPTNITVLVDSVGEVHFSNAAPPPEDGPCEGYHQLAPTSSP